MLSGEKDYAHPEITSSNRAAITLANLMNSMSMLRREVSDPISSSIPELHAQDGLPKEINQACGEVKTKLKHMRLS